MELDATALWRSTPTDEYVAASADPNPDLRFPQSVRTWDLMRRTDSQVGSVMRAITLPIKRARWTLNGEGCRPEVVAFVRQQLGLDSGTEGRQRRRRQGVVWAEHLRDALLMLPLGFMAFEQVYQPETGGDWGEQLGTGAALHLRKLAPRMPATVTKISVGRDGGLQSITQNASPVDPWDMRVLMEGGVTIPVDRLVLYVNDREGADWAGTSLLRTAYRDWYLKDQLTRINAQAVERNGMGVPVITYTQDHEKDQASQLVREFRAGATAGLALPNTMKAELLGVTGGVRDALPTIQYHDQQIAKSVLAMFLDLGHDAGARSLGDTFVDAFTDSLQAVADEIAETATEHIIRDLVELNLGPDEPYPVLEAGDLASTARLTVDALTKLTQGGLVTPDDKLEAYVRQSHGLPEADMETARVPAAEGPAAADPGAVPSVLDDAPGAVVEGQGQAALSGDELVKRANFVGTMIRSGFDPEEAMAQAGLPGIRHLGLLPVTVQPPAKGTDLENAVPPAEADLADGEHSPYLTAAQQLIQQVRAMRGEA